jgi:hypothetical protein
LIFETNIYQFMRFLTTTKAIWKAYQCRYNLN